MCVRRRQWYSHLMYLQEVGVVGRVLCQTGYDPLDVQVDEVVYGTPFEVVVLVRVGTDDSILVSPCVAFYSVQHGRVVVGYQVRYDDSYDVRCFLAQALSKRVWTIVQLLCQLLHSLSHLVAYFVAVAERAANGGYAHVEPLRKVFK